MKRKKSHKNPYFPFYPEAFLADDVVDEMSNEETGIYIRLICRAWLSNPPATLPTDEKLLAKFSRVSVERWREVSQKILPAFKIRGDRWVQKRLLFEWEKIMAMTLQNAKNGRKGAEKRWNIANIDGEAIGSATEIRLDKNNRDINISIDEGGSGPPEVERSKPDGRVKVVVDYYAKKFLAKTGDPWHVNGGKVGSLIKKLLSTYGSAEAVVERIDEFFDLPDRDFVGRAGRDFGVFYSQINKLKPGANKGGSNDGTISGSREGHLGSGGMPGLVGLRRKDYGKGF